MAVESSFDAVIVGAGHNGLATAVHLARHGWKVGVFEAKDEAGGAVKTRELTLPGFRHDVAAMNLSLFAGSPFLREHGAALSRHGLAFAPAAHCFASVFPDNSWFGVSKDPGTTLARLEAIDPRDAAAWQAMMARFGADAPHIFGLLGNVMPSFAVAKVIWKAWRQNGTAWTLDMLRFLTMPVRTWADAHFHDPRVKATVAAWGMHLDFPPDVAGGALWTASGAIRIEAGRDVRMDAASSLVSGHSAITVKAGGDITLGRVQAMVFVGSFADRGLPGAGGPAGAMTLNAGGSLRLASGLQPGSEPLLAAGRMNLCLSPQSFAA
jgi:phytoene dehydrogenase-like protein